MKSVSVLSLITLAAFVFVPSASSQTTQPKWLDAAISAVKSEVNPELNGEQRERLERGLGQVAAFWREQDGNEDVFKAFALANFARDPRTLDAIFNRFEALLEKLDGHMVEISREFRAQTDLDAGKSYPFDGVFAEYDPAAHIQDDFFHNKLAFVVLLNFPMTTLEERLRDGPGWSRRQWAEARLTQFFDTRIPADVMLELSRAASQAEQYISGYNIWMHHLVNDKGERLFPRGMRLLSHWNIRDEIKADYGDSSLGLEKQRMIQKVMERIVTQTIPAAVVDNPGLDWDPFTNEVTSSAVSDTDEYLVKETEANPQREPDTRYSMLLGTFYASRLVDKYSPASPTLMARRFEEGREIPEAEAKAMLEKVVSSPLVPRVAALITKRLGRPLEPFDIWYDGFRGDGKYDRVYLDSIVAEKFPTAQAYKDSIPVILRQLGFDRERAVAIADNIIVDPARGSGHAWGAAMRSAKAHLRTRVGNGGMDYKGYNIAVHEMGHNVEQTLSLNYVDHTLLQGVPNTAFTEAFAFAFQGRDLELLGLKSHDPEAEALKVLNDFWATYEIAGVALVDMAVWHWMYEHEDAKPAELRNAVIRTAKEVWNRYYAPVFKVRDVVLLAIYSHLIDSFLYLPDYPIGHIIAYQIEEQMRKAGNVGNEFERMATYGRVSPVVWMKHATGSPVSPDALFRATGLAVDRLGQND